MGGPTKSKPKTKSHPYAKESVNNSGRPSRSTRNPKSRVEETSDPVVNIDPV